MRDDGLLWFTALMFMAMFWLVMAMAGAKAQDEGRWAYRTYCNSWGHCYQRRVRVGPRVYSYERRLDDEWERRSPTLERGVHCKDDTVRVVGGLHVTKDGAINDAVRQWQSTVRYDHGERYMDIESARGYMWRCDRAGTNETLAGRVGEALSGGSGYQRRCVVVARPCRMPMARGDEDKRQ